MIHRLMEFAHLFLGALGMLCIVDLLWALADPFPSGLLRPTGSFHNWAQFILLLLAFLFVLYVSHVLERRDHRAYPRCSGCGYNLTGHAAMLGHPDASCPECGLILSSDNIVPAGMPGPNSAWNQSLRLAIVFAAIWTGVILLYIGPHSMRFAGMIIAPLWGWPVLVGFVAWIKA